MSEHTNETDAELAALARADDRDADRVVVHDRYHRTHDAAPSRAAPSRAELRARARLARARQLALVRERARQLTRWGTPSADSRRPTDFGGSSFVTVLHVRSDERGNWRGFEDTEPRPLFEH